MSDARLRFVHVTTFFPPAGFGGDAVQVHRLVEGLAARGHHVRVVHAPEAFAIGEGGTTEGLEPPAGVEVRAAALGRRGLVGSYLTGRPVGFRAQLADHLRDADVVHFHNPSLIGGPGALLVPDGPLVVYTTHEHWLLCPTHVLFRNGREPCEHRTCIRCTLRHHRPPQLWRYGSLLDDAVARIDLLLSPSDFTADRHRASFPDAPIEVLRHPPPSPERVAGIGAPPRRPGDRAYVLFAGRFEPIKGARWLVDALRDDPGADVVLAGDGTEHAEVAERAKALDHVHLLGKLAHADVLRWARGALALVIPSVGYESAGAVGLEAMAFGTPVLVRHLGALPELVSQGGGETFHDAAGLVSAVRRLVDDPAHRDRLRAEAAAAADPVRGDRAFFERYLSLLAVAAGRKGRAELASKAASGAAGEREGRP
jgi:glycosyltransferase involved in cell wall biosynthesis